MALRKIRKHRKSTELLIKKLPSHLVHEITCLFPWLEEESDRSSVSTTASTHLTTHALENDTPEDTFLSGTLEARSRVLTTHSDRAPMSWLGFGRSVRPLPV